MGERVFRVLLKLYPADFRRRFQGELMDFFREDQGEVRIVGGTRVVSLCGFWGRTLADLCRASTRLRLRQLVRKWSVGRVSLRWACNDLAPGSPGPGGGKAGWADGLLVDLRFSLRTLRRQPVFTVVVAGILGIGIGASTTLFSAVSGVLLAPLPYPQTEDLVFVGSKFRQGTRISGMSLPEFMDVLAVVGSVEGYAAARGRALDLVGDGNPERVAVLEVNPDYFPVLGAAPIIGRGFGPHEVSPFSPQIVLVSHDLWQRRWGGDPEIVGKTLRASDGSAEELQIFTIIGVLPPGFKNPTPLEDPFSRLPQADLWTPLPLNATSYASSRTRFTVRAVGRLRSEASLDLLNEELDALALSLAEEYPRAHLRGDRILGLGARPLLDEVVGTRGRDLLILLGATGLLLFMACANVVALLLARALGRTRELNLRAALGAGWRRLSVQLVTESLVLGLFGGGLGIGIAFLGVHAFRVLGPEDFPRMAEVTVDLGVLSFSVVLALLIGLFLGVGSAVAGSSAGKRSSPVPGTRTSTAGPRTLRLKGGLVALEVALALVLLTGCGLLTRSLLRLQSVNPGIETENLALMQVHLLPSYDQEEERRTFFRRLQEGLAALPGVVSVSHIADPPMGFRNWAPGIWRDGEHRVSDEPSAVVSVHPVGLDYFRTMGIRLTRGRTFSETDDAGGPRVLVVNTILAEELWPNEDPIGKKLDFGDPEWPLFTVVGVVEPTIQRDLEAKAEGEVFASYAQLSGDYGVYMVVRTDGDPAALSGALRAAVWGLDERIPIPEITTMDARLEATLRLPRFRALLLSAFAGVSLLLAAAGIYGTLTFIVGQRAREAGIRMALGASRLQVVAWVLRHASWPVVIGLGLGLGASLVTTRLVESFLFEVAPNDAVTIGLVTGALAGVSLLACYLPARRAAALDPMANLREE